MTNEVEVLKPALEKAFQQWEESKKGKALLAQYEIEPEILDPLTAAIESCDLFQGMSGKPIFSGYAGVVLQASTLATPLLYNAEPEYRLGIEGAVAWFKQVLTTKHAPGIYEVAVWGIAPDADIKISDDTILQSYNAAPDSPIKRRLKDMTRESWDGSVWNSRRFYEVPGAILTTRLPEFPYFGRIDLAFQKLVNLDEVTKDRLAFIQSGMTGTPVVGASWFTFEDTFLDFNSHENYLSWLVPEVEPTVRAHVAVTALCTVRAYETENGF